MYGTRDGDLPQSVRLCEHSQKIQKSQIQKVTPPIKASKTLPRHVLVRLSPRPLQHKKAVSLRSFNLLLAMRDAK
jgi:hypothetical protein